MSRSRSEAGLTLIEVVIAVSLLSVLSVGMLAAIRLGFNAMHKTEDRLMENRRVAGAQRILEQELAGFMPVKAICPPDSNAPGEIFPFFEGKPQSMRLVSTYSLEEEWRGRPLVLEMQVIPGAEGLGVRLIVNEFLYSGALSAGRMCLGMAPDPASGQTIPMFQPIQAGPQSFILADKLAFCRFSYLEPEPEPEYQRWRPDWVLPRWPMGIRVEMAPLEDRRARLRPLTVTAAIPITRALKVNYVDY
ncbi:MAG TPA: prepilin-type N-terminal cleavage/methylation domain-containing protein [Bryobacteraceae bacterium]|nr:prepilin-type N-terminal cleavage/methylation domain-containing protein [Bryobacteraceae bacterium]